MKKSNKLFLYTVFLFGAITFYYYLLLKNVPMWITDIKSCFSTMYFFSFLSDHIHIFAYMLIFSLFSFFLISGVIKNTVYTFRTFHLYRDLKNLTARRFYRLNILDTEKELAFNFGKEIFISKSIFKDKKRLKAVYLHEKAHLKNKDFYRVFFLTFILNFFPERLSSNIRNQFSLLIEVEADKDVLKQFDKKEYAKVLINSYETGSNIPAFTGYVKSRLESILLEKQVDIKTNAITGMFLSILTLMFLVEVIKTCFCGM